MRRGFHCATSSYSSFNFLRAGCGVLTMNTSAHLANRSRTCCALAAFRLRATPRLFRFDNWKGYGSSECGWGGIFCPILHNSPSGGSTFTTSAPKSDKIVAALGPAMKLDRSTTFNPENMFSPAISSPFIVRTAPNGESRQTSTPFGRKSAFTGPETSARVWPEMQMYLLSCLLSRHKWRTSQLRGGGLP